jgi:hypothetical protein
LQALYNTCPWEKRVLWHATTPKITAATCKSRNLEISIEKVGIVEVMRQTKLALKNIQRSGNHKRIEGAL